MKSTFCVLFIIVDRFDQGSSLASGPEQGQSRRAVYTLEQREFMIPGSTCRTCMGIMVLWLLLCCDETKKESSDAMWLSLDKVVV